MTPKTQRVSTVSFIMIAILIQVARLSVCPVRGQSIVERTGGPAIPSVAWSRGIGEPLNGAGRSKVSYPIIDDGYWQGAPLGGFGAGTIGRTYRGDFARWHLKTGVHKYQSIPANQFSVFQKLEGDTQGTAQVLFAGHPAGNVLTSWRWDYPVNAGRYYALYPRSWFSYRASALPVELDCEQYSPVLPQNYRETSYPVAVFKWYAHNPTGRKATVSVMMTWANMVGWFSDSAATISYSKNAGNFNRPASEAYGRGSAATIRGIIFDRRRDGGVTGEGDGQFAIAALEDRGAEVHYLATFTATGTGSEVWQSFSRDGALPDQSSSFTAGPSDQIAGAVAVRFSLEPGERRVIPFALAWDLPIVSFGGGDHWYRRYTEYFGKSGTNSWAIAATALRQRGAWERGIERWQRTFLDQPGRPDWYKGMLFNELYYLADGGAVWENGRVGDSAASRHRFSYLECFDYSYYSTLDVRFYGSFPLALFWPEIEKEEMRTFADTVPLAMDERVQIGSDKSYSVRKVSGALPHDVGAPWEAPWLKPNAYNWQNPNIWKDLNPKFVLLVYRDFILDGGRDVEFLRYCWPGVVDALAFIKAFDRDGDGLPENDGVPDQTYDTWKMKGASAYCGGLWLAALKAAAAMARALDERSSQAAYEQWFSAGQQSFERLLWNGEYYEYDTGSTHHDNIMADQLAGQWYAWACGLGDIVPRDRALSALRKIYAFNVRRFGGGEMGAVNGMNRDGSLVKDNEQSEEVWTGTTLGLAACMLHAGLLAEAFDTARGIYLTAWERKGYWFRTPEAWDLTGNFRASMYMRPQVIWAMEHALAQSVAEGPPH